MAHAASTWVPLDHPAYRLMDSLAPRGVLHDQAWGVRPISWEQLQTALQSATPAHDADREVLLRLRGEAERRTRNHYARADLRGGYTEGEATSFGTVPADNGGPLTRNDGGRTFSERWGMELQLHLDTPGQKVAASVTPRLTLGEAGGGNPGWQEGYITMETGPLLTSLGRQPIVWGPGAHGGFLLTDNAPPLPAIRTGLRRPHRFQGRLSPLGQADFSFFLARLEEARYVPHPVLTGLRLMWRPHPRLLVGASRTTMMAGDGQGVSGSDLFTIITGNNQGPDTDTSNSIAGIDITLDLPLHGTPGRAVRLYGEYAGEDEASLWPAKPAMRLGLLLAGVRANQNDTLRLEVAATDWPTEGNVWYRHGTYRSGYTYRHRIIGDALGPDGRSAALTYHRPGAVQTLTLHAAWRTHYVNRPERETHWESGVSLSRSPNRRLHIEVGGALERVERRTAPDGWQSRLLLRIGLAVG
ncbi:MAG: capsule assembly Wzi family protein [Leptospirillia bacterium]